jgi:quercetin dioxygenase-like cupin family protein
MAKVLSVDELRLPGRRTARFEGREHGAAVSFYVSDVDEGQGPGPHTHPYEETFVIVDGSAVFTVDGQDFHARPGMILVVPAGSAHGFRAGPDGLRSVNIHGAPRMEQTDL